MMTLSIRHRYFSLYHLEEGEMYIKEFASICQFLYPKSDQIERIQGIMHFASRSVIFEPDDQNHSIIKFPFRYFKERPKVQLISGSDMFKLQVNQLIEIPYDQGAYKSYEINTDVFIDLPYQKVENIAQILFELIDKYNSKQSAFDFDSIEYLGTLYSFQFDYTLIKTINEKNLLKSELIVKQLLPLIDIPGLLMLTDAHVYFQPVFKLTNTKQISIKYAKIEKFYKRRVCLREIGIEICAVRGKNLFIQFDNDSNRDMIYDLINKQTSIEAQTNIAIDKYTQLWVEGALSNYDYLVLLNSAGNRTRNDLSQYPIFPWVLTNFHSTTLDLSNRDNFRDLSKPVGALNQRRLDSLRSRYQEMPAPKFLYGTHYSTPAYVIGYLLRKHPHYMLKFHNGKFDHPDRLFHSIEIDWDLCNTTCVKELIPEFYEDNTDFLCNKNNIYFGLCSNGEKIDNATLPPWALNQNDFLNKMREALESAYVNENLSKWIDLVFGYKQRGQLAIDNNNLFHPLCYGEGISFDLNNEKGRITKLQINEFGQVPIQLFKTAHPVKYSKRIRDISLIIPYKEHQEPIDDDSQAKLALNEKAKENSKEEECIKETILSQSIEKVEALNHHQSNLITDKGKESINKDDHDICYEYKYNFTKKYSQVKAHHKKAIISSSFIPDNDTFVTGSTDGYISLFNYRSAEVTKLFYISPFPIKALTTIYSSNLIAIGSGDCITILNPNLGKTISKIYAHESPIANLYYNYQSNLLISDSISGIINTWDLAQTNKIPNDSLFLETDSDTIAFSDYNHVSNRHYAIDFNYNVHISSLCSNKETDSFSVKDTVTPGTNINFIKGDICNPNHFFISTDNEFFEYDIRKHNAVASHAELSKLKNIFIDSKAYLCIKSNEVALYSVNSDRVNELSLAQKWTQFSSISHSNFDVSREMVLLGMDNGDVFYNEIYI